MKISVGRVELHQAGEECDICSDLQAIRLGTRNVDVVPVGMSGIADKIDQIAERIRKTGKGHHDTTVKNALIYAGVIAEALLRVKGRVAEHGIVQLEQRRRLGAGAGTGVEFGAGFTDRVGGGRSPRLEAR